MPVNTGRNAMHWVLNACCAHMTWLPACDITWGGLSGASKNMGRNGVTGGVLLRKTSGPSIFLALSLPFSYKEVSHFVL